MKKIRNCKAILALAVCLTMFAGLAVTASAARPANPKCQYGPCMGASVMGFSYQSATYCSACRKNVTLYVFKCNNGYGHPSIGICGNCNHKYTIYG